jgi:glycosyltransferase involved in cell wall biosynthesis
VIVKIRNSSAGRSIGLLWAQYGPYHFARAGAFAKLAAPAKVHAIELASRTNDYAWQRPAGAVKLATLCPGGVAERLSFLEVFRRSRQVFAGLQMEVCFLPSYAPKQSLAALLAARSLGIKTVMMNETHAGTARATGLAASVKRRLIGLFDAALVGGTPQKKYFTAMGMPAEKIFTGYDAVDNDFFAARAEEIRSQKAEMTRRYDLPEHYFLSLGRFVSKKNLGVLIRAYQKYLQSSPLKQTHLVMVGSGEEEANLRGICAELQLPVYDHLPNNAPDSVRGPGVHFYGFRQIDENPVFYALADAFVLPSLWEEWGLVVNEAMASDLPVVVSETAGCAEDLLEPGSPAVTDFEQAELHRRVGPFTGCRAGQNGFVFNPRSSDALVAALLAIEASPELRQAMGRASAGIVEKFSCDNFAEQALLAARVARGEKFPATEIPVGRAVASVSRAN